MLCLCGKPTYETITENHGAFWQCGQDPSCHFICPEDEAWIYDKAVKEFLATKQDRPKCCGVTPDASAARNYAEFGVVSDITKPYFGRPFFTCSKENDCCNYFAWGNEAIIEKPLCQHGKPCRLEKVRKEGPNQGRSFLCCPHWGERKCEFFEWFETLGSRELDGKKVDDEFRRLDEENPFFSPLSGTLFSNFERGKQMCLEREEKRVKSYSMPAYDS